MDTGKVSKRWDPYIGAWVIDLPQGHLEVEIELKGQRVKTEGGWKFYPYKRPDFAKDEEVSSCEISSKGRTHTTTSFDPTWQVYPWEGLDKVKWRHTFMTLIQIYNADDWQGKGLYIDAKSYRDRIHRGVYAPENRPRHWSSAGYKPDSKTQEKHDLKANGYGDGNITSYGSHGYWVGNRFFPYNSETD